MLFLIFICVCAVKKYKNEKINNRCQITPIPSLPSRTNQNQGYNPNMHMEININDMSNNVQRQISMPPSYEQAIALDDSRNKF